MGGMLTMCQPDPFKPVKPVNINPLGKKKAVVIGVNYVGQPEQLASCVSDARTMYSFLKAKGFKVHDIILLTEDAPDPAALPTRRNIMEAIKWLVEGVAYGDSLFFFFAGHGSQVPDLDGDEDDGLDETILPMDYKAAGHIVDDELFLTLVKPLPYGCRLTAVMDCCHSGTGLDLPFGLKGTRNVKNMLTRQRSTVMVPISCKIKKSNGDVLLFSGCCDDEESQDTEDADEIVRATIRIKPRKAQQQQRRGSDVASIASDTYTAPPKKESKTDKWKKRYGCCGQEVLGVGEYNDTDTHIKLDTFCNDCDEPDAPYCKVTGKKHALTPAKGKQVKGKAGGALTTAFTTLLQDANHNVQLVDLVLQLRQALRRARYEQIVQVSGSKPFKMDTTFEI